MTTPNNAAAMTYMGRQLTAQEAVTMFANQDATIRSLRDELATLRATLAQPDALTSQLDVDALTQEIRRVDGDHSLAVDVLAEALAPYIAALTSQPSGGTEAEDRFEQYVATLIDKNPDVRRLGERLAYWLDDDRFNTVNPILLGICERLAAHPSADAPGVAVDEKYAELLPQDHNDNGKGRDNQRQPQGTTSGGSPDYSRPSHHTDRHDGQPSPSAPRDDMTAGGTSTSDDELPGMWSRSDFTGGATDAEHRQARELRTIVAGIDASESMPPTPHPDCNALVKLVDTNDWAIIRAALLRQMEVTDVMMERAIKGWLAHQNKCRITTADGCLRAALTAALAPKPEGGHG